MDEAREPLPKDLLTRVAKPPKRRRHVLSWLPVLAAAYWSWAHVDTVLVAGEHIPAAAAKEALAYAALLLFLAILAQRLRSWICWVWLAIIFLAPGIMLSRP